MTARQEGGTHRGKVSLQKGVCAVELEGSRTAEESHANWQAFLAWSSDNKGRVWLCVSLSASPPCELKTGK